MKKISSITGLISLFLFLNAFPGLSFALQKVLEPDRVGKAQFIGDYGNFPLSFEENHGQTDKKVRFLSRGVGYTLFLTADEAVLALRPSAKDKRFGDRQRDTLEISGHVKQKKSAGAVVSMKLSGINIASIISGEERLFETSNYFIGNDSSKWRTRIPKYTKVRYTEVYPGIDLVFYGNQRRLEYDFVVSPGSDPSKIRLEFQGAKEVSLDENGSLVLRINGGDVVQRAPVIYQEVDGRRVDVAGGYLIDNKGSVGFRVAFWDRQRPLLIDPVIIYSTYIGGYYPDECRAIAVDNSGNAYVTGTTNSDDFPTVNALYPDYVGNYDELTDAFLLKLSPDGRRLIYSTYLGGTGIDIGNGIAVDDSGNAYVTGTTYSKDFPTINALNPPLYPNKFSFTDAFIFKLSADGSHAIYSTYLGGHGDDVGNAIAVDGSGNAYVTGTTYSTTFPTVNAWDASAGGGGDAFIFKLSADGRRVFYSTYLGGSTNEKGSAIAVDDLGYAYVTGKASGNFPTVNALYPDSPGGRDAFIFKLSADGSNAVFSTYLGGHHTDYGNGIAVDGSGNVYVTGITYSGNFPTVNALYQYSLGLKDAFIFKLSADGRSVIYSTYLGGKSDDEGYAIAVNTLGNAYVTGWTESADFPTANAPYPNYIGHDDAFIFKLSVDGSSAVYSTYIGGKRWDSGYSIAVDNSENIYVTGKAGYQDFPTVNALFPDYPGEYASNGFILKISDNSAIDPLKKRTMPWVPLLLFD